MPLVAILLALPTWFRWLIANVSGRTVHLLSSLISRLSRLVSRPACPIQKIPCMHEPPPCSTIGPSFPRPIVHDTPSTPPPIPWSITKVPHDIRKEVENNLAPMTACQVRRGERKVRVRVARDPTVGLDIEPRQTEFVDRKRLKRLRDHDKLGFNWEQRIHPGGALYFCHPGSGNVQVFTDSYLCELEDTELGEPSPTVLDISYCVLILEDRRRKKMTTLPTNAELVVERLHSDNGKPKYGYYYVCPQNRTLFWLDEHTMMTELADLKGVKSEEHKKYALEVEYWTHCELFPHEKQIYRHLFDELRGMALHAITELLTARTPLSPFSLDELMNICQVLDYVRIEDREGEAGLQCQYSMCIISRYLRMFAESKFVNFHGQKGARLRVNQSIYSRHQPDRRSYLFRVANILLLGAPDVHMKSVKNIWVDDMLNQVPWKDFVTTLNQEWQDYTLYSTIIMTANVAFLALPDVTSQDVPTAQSVAQMISFVSTVTSLGSLILSLIMVRQNRIKGHDKVEEAREFMENMAKSVLGVDKIAIMYSLPFGLLMWSVISFVVALAFIAFDGTSTATRILVGIILGLTTVLVAWVVRVSIGSSLSSKSEEKEKEKRLLAGPSGDGEGNQGHARSHTASGLRKSGAQDVENQSSSGNGARGGHGAGSGYPPR